MDPKSYGFSPWNYGFLKDGIEMFTLTLLSYVLFDVLIILC